MKIQHTTLTEGFYEDDAINVRFTCCNDDVQLQMMPNSSMYPPKAGCPCSKG